MSAKSRNEAYKLLTQFTKTDSLLKHALAVEQAMRAYAQYYGEDENLWGNTGLLHDFDYEQFPAQHPYQGAHILEAKGYEKELVDAVLGHATYTGTPRTTRLAKVLYAVDELCGFLMACALVRPDKAVGKVKLPSIQKKLKDKAFAKGVNREDVERGVAELGVDPDEHYVFVRDALAEIHQDIGLGG